MTPTAESTVSKKFIVGVLIALLLIIAGEIVTYSMAITQSTEAPQPTSTTSTTSPTTSEAIGSPDVNIQACLFNVQIGGPYAKVGITNHGASRADYVVTVSFANEDGVQFDTAIANARSIKPGQMAETGAQSFRSGARVGFTCEVTNVTRIAA